ncbi:MAG: hypothetical protein CR972_00210 [Candidatus Moraniibacteriota bacterium]|nr:MAG: hypothetical protein CR972_00210 [Candidatus Moranbacteria bacterium]
MKKYKKRKGFTLIELLMVIAIVGILSAIILVALNSSRERASVAKYTSYATQLHRLTADAVAAGYLDAGVLDENFRSGVAYCFGEDRCWIGQDNSDELDEALTKLADYPTGYEQSDVHSPYNPNYGVTIGMKSDNTAMRIQMYLLSNDASFLQKTCDEMKWDVCAGTSCCIDVPLNTRMRRDGESTPSAAGEGL